MALNDNPIEVGHKIVTAVTPVTTDSVSFNLKGKDETIYSTPAGTIAAMTIVLPPNASSRLGQVLKLISHQTVTTLTVSSSGLTILGALGAVTALVVDTPVAYEKIAASTWQRIV